MNRRRFPNGLGALASGALCFLLPLQPARAQSPADAVAPASFTPRPAESADPADQEAPDVAMLQQLARQRGGRPEALAQFIQLTRRLDDSTTAALIDDLAEAHLRAGAIDLAAEARRSLAERFPALGKGRDAILWLVRLYASSETAHARRRPSTAAANLREQLAPQAAATLKPAPAEADDGGESAEPSADPMANYAYHLASKAIATQPALVDDPAFSFQRSVAARRAGRPKAAQALHSMLKHRHAGDPWGDCARAESWLAEGADAPCPKPLVRCARAAGPPRLDARLGDGCWQQAAGHPIGDSDGAATVIFAYDDEYLYLAAKCAKLAEVAYAADNRPRPHDGDVDRFDRVSWRLDVDRDFVTWFELVADSRGWTAETCWGDAAWNPPWFVAADRSGDGWVVEAAIPLAELAASAPQAGDAWACAIARLAPQRDHAPPADRAAGPETYCLLRFE